MDTTRIARVHQESERLLAAQGYSLILHNSDPLKGNNWLLELRVAEGDDDVNDDLAQEAAELFRTACFLTFPRSDMRWFHQGSSSHWHMFEFWTHDQVWIFDQCYAVARKLSLELTIP